MKLRASLAAAAAIGLLASASALGEPERHAGYGKLVSAAQREGELEIYSTMDAAEAAPLIADFNAMYPSIRVRYSEMNSPEVYGRFIAETETNGSSADVTWSSAMDLQLKLANDGYAEEYRPPAAKHLPEWANWRNEAYGTTFEPAVFVYNKRLVPPEEVPQTHADFAALLRAKPRKYSGNVITFDIRKSAVGFLFLTQDSLAMNGFWDFVATLGKLNVEVDANTASMMERIASGKDLIGYDLIGSYALGRARRDPSLGVVLPRDYTLILSRVILIAKRARHPAAAKLWVEYVLSRRGQTVLSERSRIFSIRPDVEGEFTAASLLRTLGPSARPIRVSPGLLVFLDQAKHRELIKRWEQLVLGH